MHQIANSLKLILEEGQAVKAENIFELFLNLKPKDYTPGAITLLRKLIQDFHIKKKQIREYLN